MFYHFQCLCPWAQFHNRFYINFRQGFLSLSLAFAFFIRIRDHFLCLNVREKNCAQTHRHTHTAAATAHKEFSKLCNWQTELEWNSIIRAKIFRHIVRMAETRDVLRCVLPHAYCLSFSTDRQHLTIRGKNIEYALLPRNTKWMLLAWCVSKVYSGNLLSKRLGDVR